MNIESILPQLLSERDRIDQAITALRSLDGASPAAQRRRPGRPAGSSNGNTGIRGRRTMSAAARRKISEAAKRRWAKVKRTGK